MRAHDILQNRAADALIPMASLLKADSPTRESILSAMRSEKLAATMLRHCSNRILKEDLALLCANPYDPVEEHELADPGLFQRAGFIERTPNGEFAVNLDMALTMVPHTHLEFGYAATILARLDSGSLASIARALEVGPKPNHVDFLVELAIEATDNLNVTNQLARLNKKDRLAIRDALEFGELPDDPSRFPVGSPPPSVSLEPGEVGRRGLVFWIDYQRTDLPARPMVFFELLGTIGDLLESVPLPPETVAARAPRRKTGPRATPARKTPIEPEPAVAQRAVTNPGLRPSDSSRITGPVTLDNRPSGVGPKQVSLHSIAGVIDLEDARNAEAASRDPELRSAILETIGDTLVVIRAGFDLQSWAEKAATRLNLGLGG